MNLKKNLLIGLGFLLIGLIILFVNNQLPDQQYTLNGNIGPEEVDIEIIKTNEYPEKLHPVIEEYRDRLIRQAAEKGIPVVITDGFRSIERQNALYEQGRSTGGSIVTNAEGGTSYHNYGLAIDFALENEAGEAIWDMEYDGNENGKSDWMEVVAIAKDLGFTWGGDWEDFPDYPHLQMAFDLRIRELRAGFRPVLATSTD